MRQITHRYDACHARATFERVQYPRQTHQMILIVGMRAQLAQRRIGGLQKFGSLLGKYSRDLRIVFRLGRLLRGVCQLSRL